MCIEIGFATTRQSREWGEGAGIEGTCIRSGSGEVAMHTWVVWKCPLSIALHSRQHHRCFSRLIGSAFRFTSPAHFLARFFFFLLLPLSQQTACIRRRSDKHIASPPDRTTISREIYYWVLHSRRWLLSKFQSNGLVILFRTRTEASFRNM